MKTFVNFLIFLGILRPVRDTKQDYEIVFGEEASKLGEHGALVGTWSRAGYGTRPITIAFHFKAFGVPPQLSKELFDVILAKCKEQGIVFSHFYSYGNLQRARCDYMTATGYDGTRPLPVEKENEREYHNTWIGDTKEAAKIAATARLPESSTHEVPIRGRADIVGASAMQPQAN